MVYVIYQVTESLTNYFDTYFSILVMNTIFFSSSKRKKMGKMISEVEEAANDIKIIQCVKQI